METNEGPRVEIFNKFQELKFAFGGFSLRRLAREIGENPAALSEFFQGKRNWSEKKILRAEQTIERLLGQKNALVRRPRTIEQGVKNLPEPQADSLQVDSLIEEVNELALNPEKIALAKKLIARFHEELSVFLSEGADKNSPKIRFKTLITQNLE